MWWVLPLVLILTGCSTWQVPHSVAGVFEHEESLPLDEYLTRQRALNEQYLFGTPIEALKSLEALAKLEEDYAQNGQKPIDSNHTRMLAYSRLFVLSERLRHKPEAEMYRERALRFAVLWRPEIGALPDEKKTDFVRSYVDDFEKGLEVRWKKELK